MTEAAMTANPVQKPGVTNLMDGVVLEDDKTDILDENAKSASGETLFNILNFFTS
jgi:hypothetical protein